MHADPSLSVWIIKELDRRVEKDHLVGLEGLQCSAARFARTQFAVLATSMTMAMPVRKLT